MASESRFGYEWDNYHWMSPDYERQFLNWTHPLTPASWKGKRFLDAGCGMGRNSYWPMHYGAASCISFDNDERSLARARETLNGFPTAEVVRHNCVGCGGCVGRCPVTALDMPYFSNQLLEALVADVLAGGNTIQ